jgi:hypothetical protein
MGYAREAVGNHQRRLAFRQGGEGFVNRLFLLVCGNVENFMYICIRKSVKK